MTSQVAALNSRSLVRASSVAGAADLGWIALLIAAGGRKPRTQHTAAGAAVGACSGGGGGGGDTAGTAEQGDGAWRAVEVLPMMSAAGLTGALLGVLGLTNWRVTAG